MTLQIATKDTELSNNPSIQHHISFFPFSLILKAHSMSMWNGGMCEGSCLFISGE